MVKQKTAFLFVSLLMIFWNISKAQEASIQLGKNNIASNEMFTITIIVKNQGLKKYSPFPDIPGFIKRGTSSSQTTNIISGKITSSQSITQNYLPKREGAYMLKPFTMVINEKKVTSNGTTIKVGPPKQQKQYDPFAFDRFFGKKSRLEEFIDVKEDAFFALTTNKDEIYVGEGVTTSLALYVSARNRAEMHFYELGSQLTEMIKKIKPANCWEENFGIEQVQPEPVKINNMPYTRYRIYESAFFPLNTEPLQFPSVGLKMIKYKVAKNPTFFGNNKKQDFKTFWASPKIINVKELPPHPLNDVVSVGIYRLEEE
ncbi:MAG: BatD family protein, partial [Bacteroidetes bacterium]|nr:BatD family protein [Bacteroidota bacterium]